MSFLRNLSNSYLQDAKRLNYTWMNLVRKSTRQTVINAINKAKSDIKPQIQQVDQALKGYTKSFSISIIDDQDPLQQLQNTREEVEGHIKNMLLEMKGLKFNESLVVTFNEFKKSLFQL